MGGQSRRLVHIKRASRPSAREAERGKTMMISRVSLKRRENGTRGAAGRLENGVDWYASATCVEKSKWVTRLVSSLGDESEIETQTIRGAEEAVLARLRHKEKA